MSKIVDFLKRFRPSLTFDPSSGTTSLAFDLDKKIELNNKEIEERINQLDEVRDKLIKAADAIDLISNESKIKRNELEILKSKLDQINKDKDTAEKILEVDKESFTRLLIETNQRTEKKSIWIGIIIGFFTGTLSSLVVWWITSK
jgi:septal ring factor EnvC (AmiA/AmiB activator)